MYVFYIIPFNLIGSDGLLVYYSSVTLGIVSFVSSILVLVSAFRNGKRVLLIPALVAGVLQICSSLIVLYAVPVRLLEDDDGEPASNVRLAVAGAVTAAGLLWAVYSWAVVLSFYVELLKHEAKRKREVVKPAEQAKLMDTLVQQT